ncbi:MAG: ATP-binding protein [Eubacteriales bacterium]|nr:ATP-binding protein [Eubacteriales bacterium]
MTNRIFRSILLVTISVLLLCFAVTMRVLYTVFSQEQNEMLKEELTIAAHGVEAGGTSFLTGLSSGQCRLTLISPDGTVQFDSEADAASMDNHLAREEIQEALAAGSGDSERFSATLMQKTMYQAKRLTDGSVLRISITQDSVLVLLFNMLGPISILLAGAIILAAVLAGSIAKRATAPLNALDLEHPLENEAYDELSPLLLRIEQQQRQINKQVHELQKKQDEFTVITNNMNEGVVLLGDTGMVVSMNPAAQAVFCADASCIGQDFLAVERSSDIRRVLEQAAQSGRGEAMLSRGGRQYAIDANRIDFEERAAGTAILAFDVTEKALAEQRRREFTANVSHELKTPLQSIIGSAELLKNDMVKPEDKPRFMENICTEAARLVTLIDDIIQLSQLDEGGELPRESVNLLEVTNEVVTALGDAAQAKHVQVSTSGTEVMLYGVRRLLYEVVYNLCDNAIKYNVEGGIVKLTVAEDESTATVSVKDSGIGIPPEHQQRVFERFYRVDKSHSRASGGTGLGLSIVKHAVQLHGGSIAVESDVGKGTQITVAFPKQ